MSDECEGLEEACDSLSDTVYGLTDQVAELKEQIEKMKCCFLCSHHGVNLKHDMNSQICKDCLENGVRYHGKLINWELKE